jgi:hypothetical protein
MKHSPRQPKTKKPLTAETSLPFDADLAGARFLEDAKQFFSALHERRMFLTGREFVEEVQKYFNGCKEQKYLPKIQTAWTAIVNRFLRANGADGNRPAASPIRPSRR